VCCCGCVGALYFKKESQACDCDRDEDVSSLAVASISGKDPLEIVLKPTGSEDEVSRDLNEIRTLCKADKQHAVDFAKCGGFCLVKSIMSKWRRSSEVQRCGCGGLAKASNQKKCFKKSQISHW